jgi:hypothetical protein
VKEKSKKQSVAATLRLWWGVEDEDIKDKMNQRALVTSWQF